MYGGLFLCFLCCPFFAPYIPTTGKTREKLQRKELKDVNVQTVRLGAKKGCWCLYRNKDVVSVGTRVLFL